MRSLPTAMLAALLLAPAGSQARARTDPATAGASAPAPGEPGTEGFEDRPQELDLSPGQRVRIDVWRGALELHRRRGARMRLEVERERVQDVACQAVSVRVTPDGIEVSTGPRGTGACTERVRLRLALPAGIRLSAAISDGPLTVDALDGEIDLLALGGGVRVTGGSGRLRATASAGDLVVDDSDAALNLATVGGAIRVSGRAGSDLEARSVSGTITLRLRELLPVRVSAETLTGDINILYPPGPRPSLQVAPGTAGVQADFVLPARPAAAGGEEEEWKVSAVEAGRPLLQLRTRHGRIRLQVFDAKLQDLEEERGAEAAETASEND